MDRRREEKQQLRKVLSRSGTCPAPPPGSPASPMLGRQRAPRSGDMASAHTRHLLRGSPPAVPHPAPAPPRSPLRPLFTSLTAQITVCRFKCFVHLLQGNPPGAGGRGQGAGGRDQDALRCCRAQSGVASPPQNSVTQVTGGKGVDSGWQGEARRPGGRWGRGFRTGGPGDRHEGTAVGPSARPRLRNTVSGGDGQPSP